MNISKEVRSRAVAKYYRSRLWSYLMSKSVAAKHKGEQEKRIIDFLSDKIARKLVPQDTFNLFKSASRIAEPSSGSVVIRISKIVKRKGKTNDISWKLSNLPKLPETTGTIEINSVNWFQDPDPKFKEKFILELSKYVDLCEESDKYLSGMGRYGGFLDGCVTGRITLGKILDNYPEEWFWFLVEAMGIPEIELYES